MDILRINEYDRCLKIPDDNVRIARYVSYEKLNDLINNKLYFCNCEKFDDDNERKTIALGKYKNRTALEIVSKLDRYAKEKCFAYVSCWTKFEHESAALWKIYDPKSNGVCIITTVGKLKKLLDDRILIGEVIYEREDRIAIPELSIEKVCSNYFGTEFMKIAPYKYEKEIRAVFYSKDRRDGELIHINFNELVEDVYLSPFANDSSVSKAKELLLQQIQENKIKYSVISESKKILD